MADNNNVITRSPSKDPTVTHLVFNVANHSSFWDGSEGQDISHSQGGLFTAVNKLPSEHSFRGDEQLLLVLVTEGVAESDAGQRGATTRIVDDVGDDSFQVPIALAEVEGAEPGGAFPVVGVGSENGPCSLTLSSDHTTHLGFPV